MIRTQQGGFALLGRSSESGGTADTSYSTHLQNGPKTYSIDAKTHSERGSCDLYLFGQKIYSTRILSRMRVVASFDPTQPAPQKITETASLGSLSNSKVSQLQGTGFSQTLRQTLTPKAEALQWIADSLGLSLSDTQTFFTLSSNDLNALLELNQLSTLSPFGINEEQTLGIWGSPDEIGSITRPSLHTESLIAALAVNQVQWGDQSNSADLAFLKFNLNVQIQPSTTTPGALEYTSAGLKVMGAAPYDDGASIQCFLKRLSLMSAANQPLHTAFLPAYTQVKGSCPELTADFKNAFLNSPEALKALNHQFQGVSGSTQTDYAGWDHALRGLAGALFSQEKSLQATLDPQGVSPVIDRISQYIDTLQTYLKQYSDLAQSTDASQNLLQTAIHWALTAQVVSHDAFLQIMDSLNNTVASFPQSSLSLIQALSENPMSPENMRDLAFARGLGNDYKNTAARMSALIAGLNEDDFVSKKLDQVIQQNYTLAQLQSWVQQISAAQSFATRDRARKTSDDTFFDENLKTVLDRGLKEGWSDYDYLTLETIAPLANYSEFCDLSTGSDSTLANCGSNFDEFSVAPGKFMDPKFKNRYAGASQVFQSYFQRLSDSSFFSDRDILMNAFFGPVWQKCSNSEFDTRLNGLTKLVNQLSASDSFQNFQIEDQMRNLLSDCSRH